MPDEELEAFISAATLTGTEYVFDLNPNDERVTLALAAGARLLVATAPSMHTDRPFPSPAARGPTNVVRVAATADPLPFPDESFDLVTWRYVALRLPDLPGALYEVARVLRSGGRFLAVDLIAPEEPVLDRFINAVAQSWTHPNAHGWAYRLSSWSRALEKFALRYELLARWDKPLHLGEPAAPSPSLARLMTLLDEAPPAAVAAFGITPPPMRSLLRPAALFAGTK